MDYGFLIYVGVILVAAVTVALGVRFLVKRVRSQSRVGGSQVRNSQAGNTQAGNTQAPQ